MKNKENTTLRRLSLLLCTVLATLCAAVPSGAQTSDGADATADDFPYPTVPAELKTVGERAAYVMKHYWDGIDFADTVLIVSRGKTELGFVNFLDLLTKVGTAQGDTGLTAFCDRAFAKSAPAQTCDYYADLAEKYLYYADSPMRDERLYTRFLRARSAVKGTSESVRASCHFLITNILKNQPGSRAADFRYIGRDGNASSLYDTKSELTVLFFYNPDCETCHEAAARLGREPLLTSDSRVKVLAVYPDGDTASWKSHSSTLPPSWADVCSPDGEIASRMVYYLRSTPSIYLLDRDKRVILKDATADELVKKLASLTGRQAE